ncbi:MAG: 2-oxoglutarate dehydrogenase E1 component [Cardiobacteriaceae bacterium]|nr:2-oxoglutarate dehydrogenase E1 component [Cardiobacteriaceae bacterium]
MKEAFMSDYKKTKSESGISGGNAAYIEELYEDFLADPSSVSENWQKYFSEIKGNSEEKSRLDVQERFAELAKLPATAFASGGGLGEKQLAVLQLIYNYRQRGHRHANIDPAQIRVRRELAELTLQGVGLSDADKSSEFSVMGAFGQEKMQLGELHQKLEATYSGSIGLEYGHLWELEEIKWLTERFEKGVNYKVGKDEQKQLLRELVAADGLEKYLHKRYVGQKRFSLEGGDGLIPMLNSMIRELAKVGTEEICIGMAHRGRLNVLINILGKRPQLLFDEFDGKLEPTKNMSGDVKYHMGFSSFIELNGQKIDLSMTYNPSHLEFVNAVTLGTTRARLERRRMEAGEDESILSVSHKATPIMIHGDAALTGQGVNQEVLQLSQLRNYQVGGSLHIVINNQIGFTTSNLLDARSSMYCTDIAKAIQVPILHVNGDDPEALKFAAEIAVEYLHKFQKDIFIDLVCYRRLGHNEADEPAATQPQMYTKIRAHDVPAKVYADKLLAAGVIEEGEYQRYQDEYRVRLESGERVAEAGEITGTGDFLASEWKKLAVVDWDKKVDTTFPETRLAELGQKAFNYPDDFTPHPIVKRTLEARRAMSKGEQLLDWGAAENLAYASLLDQGYSVRVSGEDCGRGTFSHRHAMIHDQKTGDSYLPLQHLHKGQPSIRVIDSLLSETGVLGFEYGYSIAEPRGLVIWEAQFGDFANVAQVIIDQFIASGETKWGRYSGLVMLLPHGYEGQGPEHSSARLERYLQLSACNNWQVCVPSTPSQVFHMLRRQVLRTFRKPLVVMSPKSLLRHKLAVSSISELANGAFREVIDEIDTLDKKAVKRIIFCAGKVYYDLLEKRREAGIKDIAIVRIEQLYPLPQKLLREVIATYSTNAELIWCQEEPHNQGAWNYLIEPLQEASGRRVSCVSRPESASTAAGYAKVHSAEQIALVKQALGLA